MAVSPLRSRFIGPLGTSHMEYTGNGIQNWFLKEIELFIYYVKAPLRGLLKEIPENHLFHLGLETPACVLHMTQLSRLKQQNWKEMYIRFQLTVSILYKSFFYYFFMVYSPQSSDSATSVGLSIRLSVRQAMCWCLDMSMLIYTWDPLKIWSWAYRPMTKPLLSELSWPYRFEKTSWGWAVPSWFLLDSILLWLDMSWLMHR